jgi:hypothetical protein
VLGGHVFHFRSNVSDHMPRRSLPPFAMYRSHPLIQAPSVLSWVPSSGVSASQSVASGLFTHYILMAPRPTWRGESIGKTRSHQKDSRADGIAIADGYQSRLMDPARSRPVALSWASSRLRSYKSKLGWPSIFYFFPICAVSSPSKQIRSTSRLNQRRFIIGQNSYIYVHE